VLVLDELRTESFRELLYGFISMKVAELKDKQLITLDGTEECRNKVTVIASISYDIILENNNIHIKIYIHQYRDLHELPYGTIYRRYPVDKFSKISPKYFLEDLTVSYDIVKLTKDKYTCKFFCQLDGVKGTAAGAIGRLGGNLLLSEDEISEFVSSVEKTTYTGSLEFITNRWLQYKRTIFDVEKALKRNISEGFSTLKELTELNPPN